MADKSLIPAFCSRNIGCDNHDKGPTAGAAQKNQIFRTHFFLVSCAMGISAMAPPKERDTMSKVIAL
jgi:hypothetical protein